MLALYGPVTSYSGDYSTGDAQIILPHVTGEADTRGRQTSWSSILKHSRLIVLWGAELITNNIIGYQRPDHCVLGPLDELKAKRPDIAVVTIDPVRTDTAEYVGAEWIPLHPNADVALMLVILLAGIHRQLHDRFRAHSRLSAGRKRRGAREPGDTLSISFRRIRNSGFTRSLAQPRFVPTTRSQAASRPG